LLARKGIRTHPRGRTFDVKTWVARRALGALVGALTAGVALGIGALVAAFVRPAADPIIAVGNHFILLTPEPLKEFAIRHFGTHDKQVLLAGIYAIIAVFAVLLGNVAMRSVWAGVAGMAIFGAIGVDSALSANAHRGSDVVPAIVATVAAMGVLVVLVRAARAESSDPAPRGTVLVSDRRVFLGGGLAALVVAAASGIGGRALQRHRFDAAKSRARVTLPRPSSPAPALATGTDLAKSGVPFVTPNSQFYRVDTAISVPQLNADTWSLKIGGMVDKPVTLSFADLLTRPMIERYVTMTCVSNEVGGSYVGTARFLGVPLADLLREVGVRQAADQIVGKSSDGMTIGTPTAVIMDGRDAMLAVGMNGEPLPVQHGFPVRMLVPGLYGYVSACKWLVELEATTFADFDTYWVKRKWAAKAPIRLAARIDRPKPFGHVRAGETTMIAGVAWHQHVGIGKVEVQMGDGAWTEARLGRVPSTDTWVQWVLPWKPTNSGSYSLRVRATDRSGQLQDSARRSPFPSGSSGWQSVVVQVDR
jgi:DMSO/TMAO reductase YedYZ molybdopterin-dependent catalytic subunit